MIVTISPSKIYGNIYAPASKSSMQRACAAALLSKGETIINNPGNSNDDLAALDVIQKLGATVTPHGANSLLIKSNRFPSNSSPNGAINCGESGLGLRMFAPIAALSSHEITLTGSGSLMQRPMHFFDDIFPKLNISIQSNNGKLPIKIKGPLTPADITIDGSLSSQFLTGLLMAYATSLRLSPKEGEKKKSVSIKVEDLTSKPYIDLTLQVMKHFGWNVKNRNYEEFSFEPGISKRDPTENSQIPVLNSQLSTTHYQVPAITYQVEGDWSSASFLLVAAAISGSIIIDGLDVNSTQADKAIMKALELAGAPVSLAANQIVVQASALKPFYFNASECPDLFPPLVALACYCNGQSIIEGVHRLTHKESNRTIALIEEFGKMGIKIKLQDDAMIIEGGTGVKSASVHSHHDHRIAMACAVAALQADGETIIYAAAAVNKSYPRFYDHLKSLKANLQKT